MISQENTGAGVSFLINLQALGQSLSDNFFLRNSCEQLPTENFVQISSFSDTGFFLYLLKQETSGFPMFSGDVEIAWNGLIENIIPYKSYVIVGSVSFVYMILYKHIYNMILFDRTNDGKLPGSIIFVVSCFWFRSPYN